MNTATIFFRKHGDAILYLFSSILVTMFLFYIDEGYYSFQWMTSIGAWIVFLIYASVFWFVQLGVDAIILRKLTFRIRRAFSLVLGISIGMIFLLFIFYQSLGK